MPKRGRPSYLSSYAAGAQTRRRQAQRRRAWRRFGRRAGVVPRAGYTTVPRTRGWAAQGEMKYFDSSRAAIALTASADWTGTEVDPATLNTLFVPTQGAAINQRIGQGCDIHKIKIRGTINVPAQVNLTAASTASIVRIILVQDMQTNASQVQGETIMDSFGDSVRNIHAFQNVDNFGRFRVLKDRKINMQDPNISWDGTNMEAMGLTKIFRLNCNFATPIRVRFNATNGGSIADIVDNSFHVIAMATNISLAPTILYTCRVCFKE